MESKPIAYLTARRIFIFGPTERPLHLAAYPDRQLLRVEFDVRPLEPLALRYVGFQLDIVSKTERQELLIQ
jgi:hypothetical protein